MQSFIARSTLKFLRRAHGYASRRSFSAKERLVAIKDEEGVKNIILNSPQTRNALSLQMLDELIDGIVAAKEESIRCVVLSAAGPVFSSGHNLKELEKGSKDLQAESFRRCADLMIEIMRSPVPVIACVNGIAAAAGCQLVATCDIVIASEGSFFSTPGANVGLFCSTPGIALSRNVSPKAALRMLLTAVPVTAAEALQMGLISRMCKENELEREVETHVNAIKQKSRSVLALGKKFFYSHLHKDISSAYDLGTTVMTHNLLMDDGREGLKSFVEKRKPNWKHTELYIEHS